MPTNPLAETVANAEINQPTATQTINLFGATTQSGFSNDNPYSGQLSVDQLIAQMQAKSLDKVKIHAVENYVKPGQSEGQPAIKIKSSSAVCLILASKKLREEGVDIVDAIKNHRDEFKVHVDDIRNPQRTCYLTREQFSDVQEGEEIVL